MAAHIALAGSRVTTALYALSLHASEFTIGTLIALFALFPMVFAVPMGRLIDRIGVKKPMLCGCISICAGCAIPSLVGGLPVLYLAVILIGTGFMAIHIGSQQAVGAMSTMEMRSANFSWLALGFSISGFCGPVIAGFIIDHARFAIGYAVCGGFALVASGLMACSSLNRVKPLQHDNKNMSGGTLDLLRDPEMRRIYFIGILLASAWDLFTFVTPIHGSRLGFSASTIGLILGAFSAATFTVRLAMPRIARRYTEWQVLTAALILAVISYALFPFMRHPFSLMAVAAMLGLALGSSQPNVLALLHHAAPPGRGGEAIGIRATIGNASQVILPIAFGAAGAALGLFTVFWGIGAMIGAGIPLAWRKASIKQGD
ncbi:MAG: transporter [Herminiimonas sp.]|nr:transporter [Herminiimonas sp.]